MSLTARAVADACTGPLLLQLRCYRTYGQTASLQNLLSFIAKALTQRDGIDSTVDGATCCVSEASNISISHSCNLETRYVRVVSEYASASIISTRISVALEA